MCETCGEKQDHFKYQIELYKLSLLNKKFEDLNDRDKELLYGGRKAKHIKDEQGKTKRIFYYDVNNNSINYEFLAYYDFKYLK